MKYFIGMLSVLFIWSCSDTEHKTEKESIIAETDVLTENTNSELVIEKPLFDYTTESTFSPEHGWGYKILNNGELYINQPHIPSLPGNNGFNSEENALKTANFVIYKLNNGLVPPTVSPEELDSLGVLE